MSIRQIPPLIYRTLDLPVSEIEDAVSQLWTPIYFASIGISPDRQVELFDENNLKSIFDFLFNFNIISDPDLNKREQFESISKSLSSSINQLIKQPRNVLISVCLSTPFFISSCSLLFHNIAKLIIENEDSVSILKQFDELLIAHGKLILSILSNSEQSHQSSSSKFLSIPNSDFESFLKSHFLSRLSLCEMTCALSFNPSTAKIFINIHSCICRSVDSHRNLFKNKISDEIFNLVKSSKSDSESNLKLKIMIRSFWVYKYLEDPTSRDESIHHPDALLSVEPKELGSVFDKKNSLDLTIRSQNNNNNNLSSSSSSRGIFLTSCHAFLQSLQNNFACDEKELCLCFVEIINFCLRVSVSRLLVSPVPTCSNTSSSFESVDLDASFWRGRISLFIASLLSWSLSFHNEFRKIKIDKNRLKLILKNNTDDISLSKIMSPSECSLNLTLQDLARSADCVNIDPFTETHLIQLATLWNLPVGFGLSSPTLLSPSETQDSRQDSQESTLSKCLSQYPVLSYEVELAEVLLALTSGINPAEIGVGFCILLLRFLAQKSGRCMSDSDLLVQELSEPGVLKKTISNVRKQLPQRFRIWPVELSLRELEENLKEIKTLQSKSKDTFENKLRQMRKSRADRERQNRTEEESEVIRRALLFAERDAENDAAIKEREDMDLLYEQEQKEKKERDKERKMDDDETEQPQQWGPDKLRGGRLPRRPRRNIPGGTTTTDGSVTVNGQQNQNASRGRGGGRGRGKGRKFDSHRQQSRADRKTERGMLGSP